MRSEYSDALRENHFGVWMLYHGFIKNEVIGEVVAVLRITYHHFVREVLLYKHFQLK